MIINVSTTSIFLSAYYDSGTYKMMMMMMMMMMMVMVMVMMIVINMVVTIQLVCCKVLEARTAPHLVMAPTWPP